MLQYTIPEFGRIPKVELGEKLVQKLWAFDEQHARSAGDFIFDWDRRHHIRALNFVGVVQVPGLIIEILPKIDSSVSDGGNDADNELLAQHNLLYMLSISRDLPIRDRDLASQHIRRLPLIEALITLFVTKLLTELRRGIEHRYVYREENLPYVKGRLLLSQHVRMNIARHDRNFVGFDEFEADTWLNRIFKACCRRLLFMARSARTQQFLKESLLELADVSDVHIEEHHFDQVHLDRSSKRFETLLKFCQLILLETTPGPSVGSTQTFSLLFPMDRLFEEFIGRFLLRYADQVGLERSDVHLQARGRRRWLLRDEKPSGKFQLRPDIVIDGSGPGPKAILDTKWKRLKTDVENAKNGVSTSDIYQLYAYANRYDCPDNILLYPQVAGVSAKTYTLDGDDEKKQLRVAFINLNRDLANERAELASDLKAILDG